MLTFHVDMDQKCPKCGKPGSVNGGLCFACALKTLKTTQNNAGKSKKPRAHGGKGA
jgi:hypothetical protein